MRTISAGLLALALLLLACSLVHAGPRRCANGACGVSAEPTYLLTPCDAKGAPLHERGCAGPAAVVGRHHRHGLLWRLLHHRRRGC